MMAEADGTASLPLPAVKADDDMANLSPLGQGHSELGLCLYYTCAEVGEGDESMAASVFVVPSSSAFDGVMDPSKALYQKLVSFCQSNNCHRMQEDVVRLPQPGPLDAGDFVQLVTARSVGLEP
jgi:hypothetical protein